MGCVKGAVVAAAVTLLCGSCTFEVRKGDLAYRPDGAGADAASDAGPGDADTGPDRVHLPDADAAADGLEVADVPVDAEGDVTGKPCQQKQECDDGIACTVDWCLQGFCKHLPTDELCDDQNACTKDACKQVAGCTIRPLPGADCASPDKCVLAAQCSAEGKCEPTESMECEGDQCVEGKCDPATGKCGYAFFNGKECDDGNPCTGPDACSQGKCVGSFAGDKCKCGSTAECAQYENGDKCDGTLACVDGFCQVDPDSLVQCPEVPEGGCVLSWCDAATGACLKEAKDDESACSDGNDCTVGDECTAGECTGVTKPEGAACDLDGSVCTTDKCQGGLCQTVASKVCPGGTLCFPEQCDPVTGGCGGVAAPDGTPCNDDKECTVEDECKSGLCMGGVDVCADCTQPQNVGHPCSDKDDATAADFCYGKSCLGFALSSWGKDPAGSTRFLRSSSIGKAWHGLGLKWSEGQTPAARFVEYDDQGDIVAEVSYSGSSLLEIDGKVAVGTPNRLYYFSPPNGWIANSTLKTQLQALCPYEPTKTSPVAVADRFTGPDVVAPGPAVEVAVVGFSTPLAGPAPPACVLAACWKDNGGLWTCEGLPYLSVFPNTAVPAEIEVTTVWGPALPGKCANGVVPCFTDKAPLYATARVTAGDGKVELRVFKGVNDKGAGYQFTKLYGLQLGDEGEGLPTVATDSRTDGDGNFFAVGTNGFLFVAPAGGQAYLVLPFPSLSPEVPHYRGIYRDGGATLLAATLAAPGEAAGTTKLRLGVLTGSAQLLLGNQGTEQPYFQQLFGFTQEGCAGCEDSPVLKWGAADLVVDLDHAGTNVLTPVVPPPNLVVVGTVPDPETGVARAVISRFHAGP